MSDSSSDKVIGSDSQALASLRHLYDKHFCNHPTFYHSTGNTLLELSHRIEEFTRQRDVLVSAHSCVEIFDQLTCGLHETLVDLDEELEASKGSVGMGWARRNDSLNLSNLSRISEYQEKLRYYELSVDIIVDAVARPEPDISSPNSQTRHDGLQRLRTILDNFFQNLPTSTTGLEVGEILSADTIYYARCQAARRLAQNLRAHIRQATGTVGSRNQLSAWKMQRALYWYSVSSTTIDSKSVTSGGDFHVAKSLFDGIKSALLLYEALHSISSVHIGSLAELVMLLLEDRLLSHLRSYGLALDDPDYHLILQHADFTVSIPMLEDWLPRGRNVPQALEPSLNETPRSNLDHRSSYILLATPTSSTQNGKREGPNTRQPSSSNAAISRTMNQAAPDQSRSPPRKPLKGSSAFTGSRINPSSPPVKPQQQTAGSRSSLGTHLRGTLFPTMQQETLPSLLPELSITDDKITYQDNAHKYIHLPDAPFVSSILDGLLVATQEQAITVKNLEDIRAYDGETEVENKESKDGFQHTIFAAQRATTSNGGYEAVKVRIFRNGSGTRLRIWTSFAGKLLHELSLDLSCDELVPLYASADNIEDGSELYLRHQGEQHGLRYKFRQRPDRNTELYGFQGAVTSSDFEEQYSVRTVSFTGTSVPDAENPKIQIWTEFKDLSQSSPIFKALEDSGQSTIHGRRDNTLPVNVENLIGQVACSKIFIFSSGKIFVALITDRIRLKVVKERRMLSGQRPQTKILLVPNRDRGCTSVRYRTLRPSRGKSAALPLNHNGIRYADQNTSKFADCRSIAIDFHSSKSCAMFQNLFNELLDEWEARCAPLVQFRDMQRERIVTTMTNNIVVG